jgi:protein-S-isoprenylcysteine O-methyltransferase Ste14
MRRVATVLGWLLLILSAALILLSMASWPPGGLMFTLPFVFLMPGIIFGLLGGILVWWGSRRVSTNVSVTGEQ